MKRRCNAVQSIFLCCNPLFEVRLRRKLRKVLNFSFIYNSFVGELLSNERVKMKEEVLAPRPDNDTKLLRLGRSCVGSFLLLLLFIRTKWQEFNVRHMNFSLKFNCLNDNLKTGIIKDRH